MDSRDWRDAKMPKWAQDAVQSEIDQWRLTAALSWPTEAKPSPLSFKWGDYDRLIGKPVPGNYWITHIGNHVEGFELARRADLQAKDARNIIQYKEWAFRFHGRDEWTSNVLRGPIFATEHDAKLYRRWLLCEDFARKLMKAMA